MSDELIDDLTIECYCDGEGKCYRCRAADEIDRLTERLAGAYASVNLLTEMLEAKAPPEATESRPVFDYERFSKDFKEAVPFVAPRMEPQTPTHQQLFSGINHFAREILRLTDTVPADCAPHEPQGWQPIETAPQDGTPVIVTNDECGGAWVAKFEPVYTSGYRPDNPWFSLMLNTRWHTNKFGSSVPTHWQPFPGGLHLTKSEPRFSETYCSQCGQPQGPGDAGVSNCYDHRR